MYLNGLRAAFAAHRWRRVASARPPRTTLAARARKGGGAPGDRKLRASMNGRVVALLVAAGDHVTAGQPMVTLEAMKMEHVHAARTGSLVIAVHVAAGEQVSSGRVVV